MRVSTRWLLRASVLTGMAALGSACAAGMAGTRVDSSPPGLAFEPIFTGEEGTGGAGYADFEEVEPEFFDAPLNLGGNPVGGRSFLSGLRELELEPEVHLIFDTEG